MTITYDFDAIWPWMQEHPNCFVIGGLLIWYMLAGIVLKIYARLVPTADRADLCMAWMGSLIFAPLAVVIIAAMIVAWAVSFGLVPLPWRLKP